MSSNPLGRALALAVLAATSGCASEMVVLLADEQGNVGEVAVTSRDSEVVLDRPLAAAHMGGVGGVAGAETTEGEVNTRFAGAIAATPPAPARYVLYFREGTTVLEPHSRPDLARMLGDVAGRETVEVEVTGHTDRVGKIADNDQLSRDRARVVSEFLIEKGITREMVRTAGRGEREPRVPTGDEVREPRNRRVVVTVR